MPSESEPRCYSRRLLSPFRGIQAVIELGDSRALSYDGFDWQIEINTDRAQKAWGRMDRQDNVRQFFRYGQYNAAQGLRSYPLNPLMPQNLLDSCAMRMAETIQDCESKLPFQLQDCFELWLLDQHQRPLALLQSSSQLADTDKFRANRWHPCEHNDHSFHSPYLHRHLAQNAAHKPPLARTAAHAQWLTQALRQLTAKPIESQWFTRAGLLNSQAQMVASVELPETRSDLPELLLATDLATPPLRQVMNDYHAWQAPRLLMLPYLNQNNRFELQKKALKQPQEVDRLHRLYPPHSDSQFVATARIAAQLEKTLSTSQNTTYSG